nr:MAG TPA: hypothetical protein [Caudoviricetes sp.]
MILPFLRTQPRAVARNGKLRRCDRPYGAMYLRSFVRRTAAQGLA